MVFFSGCQSGEKSPVWDDGITFAARNNASPAAFQPVKLACNSGQDNGHTLSCLPGKDIFPGVPRRNLSGSGIGGTDPVSGDDHGNTSQSSLLPFVFPGSCGCYQTLHFYLITLYKIGFSEVVSLKMPAKSGSPGSSLRF